MRAIITRVLLGVLILTSAGVALSACRHTVSGAKQDIQGDTKK